MLTHWRDFKEATRNIIGLEKQPSNQRLEGTQSISFKRIEKLCPLFINTLMRNRSMLTGGSSISKQRIKSNHYLNEVKARQTHSEKQATKESNYPLGTNEVSFTCNA